MGKCLTFNIFGVQTSSQRNVVIQSNHMFIGATKKATIVKALMKPSQEKDVYHVLSRPDQLIMMRLWTPTCILLYRHLLVYVRKTRPQSINSNS